MDCRTLFQRRPDLFTLAPVDGLQEHLARAYAAQSAGRNPLLPVQHISIIDESFLLASPFLTLPVPLSISILPRLSSGPALPPYPSFNLVVLFSVGLCSDLLPICLLPFLGVKQHHAEIGEQHRHHVMDPAETNYNFKAEV